MLEISIFILRFWARHSLCSQVPFVYWINLTPVPVCLLSYSLNFFFQHFYLSSSPFRIWWPLPYTTSFRFFLFSVFIAWNHKSDNETRWYSIGGLRSVIENRFCVSIKVLASDAFLFFFSFASNHLSWHILRHKTRCDSVYKPSGVVSLLMGFWWTLQVGDFETLKTTW